MAKDSFLLYTDWGEQISRLSDAQAGVLFKNIFAYKTGKTGPEMDAMTEMCFSFLKSQIDRDSAKYEDICEKRREAGRKGGKANGSKCKQLEANANFAKHYDTDTDTEYDYDSDNDDDEEKKKEKNDIIMDGIKFSPKVKLGWKRGTGS